MLRNEYLRCDRHTLWLAFLLLVPLSLAVLLGSINIVTVLLAN
jgi:hypothetical protein